MTTTDAYMRFGSSPVGCFLTVHTAAVPAPTQLIKARNAAQGDAASAWSPPVYP